MSSQKPLVYLVLGAAGSGRREILADLIDGSADESGRTVVMLAEGEVPDPADSKLASVSSWRWTADKTIDAALPDGANAVFFISDGRHNPVDQIEAFKPWLAAQGGELARVLCVVNCRLAEQNPSLLHWFEACIHFSDVVLLTRREGVANKWMSDFVAHFTGQFLPCLFEIVKAGRVKNPLLVLEPQARRVSHYFDEEQEWVVAGGEDEDDAEGEEEVEVTPEEDPYLARLNGGRRQKEIPDIGKFLQHSGI